VTPNDRRAFGAEWRDRVPLRTHAEWQPPVNRPDPVEILIEQGESRIPDLVSVRNARMKADAFAFLRGAPAIMARDLASVPVTSLRLQLCGDCHLSNFGAYATPEGIPVCDINDFDETLPVLDVLENAIRGASPAGVTPVPILSDREWLDSSLLRRFQWTGIVGEGKRCHTNKVPCHPELEKTFADFLDTATDVIRYFKNERFGFSITYYEGNRPRQYYPDFIVTTREDGREVMWVAETKGEIRPNTALKSAAARLWCEKMRATTYGPWRYLFIPQKRLETALAKGLVSLRELASGFMELEPAITSRQTSAEEVYGRGERLRDRAAFYSASTRGTGESRST
jgi:hypothetical protein